MATDYVCVIVFFSSFSTSPTQPNSWKSRKTHYIDIVQFEFHLIMCFSPFSLVRSTRNALDVLFSKTHVQFWIDNRAHTYQRFAVNAHLCSPTSQIQQDAIHDFFKCAFITRACRTQICVESFEWRMVLTSSWKSSSLHPLNWIHI